MPCYAQTKLCFVSLWRASASFTSNTYGVLSAFSLHLGIDGFGKTCGFPEPFPFYLRYSFYKKGFGAVSKQNTIAKPQINIINMTNFHCFKTRLRRRARGEPLELKTGGVYVGFLKIQKVSRELFVLLCYFFGQKPVFVRLLQNGVLQQPQYLITIYSSKKCRQSRRRTTRRHFLRLSARNAEL